MFYAVAAMQMRQVCAVCRAHLQTSRILSNDKCM